MTSDDLKGWRKRLGFTWNRAREELGISDRTIYNYARGAFPIPKAIELACCELERRHNERPRV